MKVINYDDLTDEQRYEISRFKRMLQTVEPELIQGFILSIIVYTLDKQETNTLQEIVESLVESIYTKDKDVH